MSVSKQYILDAVALIEAKDRHYVNTFEMLRSLGEKFVRSTKRRRKRR